MNQRERVATAAPWAVGAVLVLLGLLVALSGVTAPVDPVPQETVTLPSAPPPTPQAEGLERTAPTVPPEARIVREPSPLWRWVVTAVLVLFVAGVAWLAMHLRRLARDDDDDLEPPAPPRHGARTPSPPDLVAAADDGLALLSSTADVQDAVIACWVRLEQAAAETGVPRHPAATPSEFTADLLVAGIGRQDEVRELLGLYHLARFGSRPLPDGAGERAVACLEAIRASAQARGAVPTSDPTSDPMSHPTSDPTTGRTADGAVAP